MRAVGQHSSATPEWGSPRRIAWLSHAVMGHIDVDPASNTHWNKTIRAKAFIDKKQDGRRTSWVPGAPKPTALAAQRRREMLKRFTAFVNPPGERTGDLVAFYWRTLTGYHELGYITSAIWVGFSVEQLARLQRVGAASHPLQHVTLIPSKRLHYTKRRGKASQPGHASFVTLLTRSAAEVSRFKALGSEFGEVMLGSRWR